MPGAARWIAEALESGDPLAALPLEIAPRDTAAGAEVAAEVLEDLGLVPCGLRLMFWQGVGVAGPMLEARLLPDGATVGLGALRHPLCTAAAIGVLAEELAEEGDGPPRFSALHPALDISATRFTEAPEDPAILAADLGRLGLVVAGRRKRAEPGALRVAIGPRGARARGTGIDLAAAFAEAARQARRLGGLPAGAMIVLAGLTAPLRPEGAMRASLGALGAAEAVFSP
jgi:hypothetical protein